MVQKREPLTREEMDRILNVATDDEYWYMLFLVARTTGRRLGEYYGVQVRDLDLDKGVMLTKITKKFKRKLKGKTPEEVERIMARTPRVVEKEAILNPQAVIMLRRYITQNNLQLDDYVFRKTKYRQIQNKIKYYSKKAGITKNVSFHSFRHYFITELVKKRWSYDKIAKLTGHSSVGTLAIYDHAVASDIKADALEALKDM